MNASAEVQLRLPAESAYVAVLRMTTAGLAARLDFTLDDIEDLRIAVGEASALVLESASPNGALHADFVLSQGRIDVSVSVPTASAPPDLDSFGWQVLTALVDDLDASPHGGGSSVTFSMSSHSNSPLPPASANSSA